MTRTIRLGLSLAAAAAVITLIPARPGAATPFVLHAGEHICLIGNQLAERLQYEGWLDTLLHARFPRHDLVIRNLGFSGDEVATRLRSKNFGTPDEWLSGVGEEIGGYKENRLKSTNTKADVIFAFFGYNESYAGDAGLPAFRKQLDEWITHTLAQKYNGKTAPRIVRTVGQDRWSDHPQADRERRLVGNVVAGAQFLVAALMPDREPSTG